MPNYMLLRKHGTVDFLKFQALHACKNGLNKQQQSDQGLHCLLYSDKHFVNSSPDNKHFISNHKGKSV